MSKWLPRLGLELVPHACDRPRVDRVVHHVRASIADRGDSSSEPPTILRPPNPDALPFPPFSRRRIRTLLFNSSRRRWRSRPSCRPQPVGRPVMPHMSFDRLVSSFKSFLLDWGGIGFDFRLLRLSRMAGHINSITSAAIPTPRTIAIAIIASLLSTLAAMVTTPLTKMTAWRPRKAPSEPRIITWLAWPGLMQARHQL